MRHGNLATVRILIEQMYYKFKQMSRANSDLLFFSILTQQKKAPFGKGSSDCRKTYPAPSDEVLPVGETSAVRLTEGEAFPPRKQAIYILDKEYYSSCGGEITQRHNKKIRIDSIP